METNYEKIVRQNLSALFGNLPDDLEKRLPAVREDDSFLFRAFGEECRLAPAAITLSGKEDHGPRGLIVSLYGNHAKTDPLELLPFKSFKDFPGSAPYHGAFSVNSERVLVPHVSRIKEAMDTILEAFQGEPGREGLAGDLSFLLYPLPKIALGYIFYMADEDFPASVTCLFSANAQAFLPLDGLADVAEYTSKAIINLIERPA